MSKLDRFFELEARGTTVGRETVAGFTTFAAMAYILAVNPAIMAAAGMDRVDLVVATGLSSLVGCLLVGLLSNLPLAAAPAMGSNIVFAYVLVKQMGIPWQAGLAIVIVTGVMFLALSLSKLRERVARDVPEVLKVAIQASVGMLIVFIALRGSGFVVSSPGTLVKMNSLGRPFVLLTLAGILLTPVLVARRVPGALILSIGIMTAAGLVVPGADGKPLTRLPAHLLALPHWPAHTALKPDFGFVASHLLLTLPLMFYFFCSEFFSTLGTVIGVTGAANLREPDGSIPNATRTFAADAMSTIVGPLLGTSVVTIFIESVTGVQAGGRTGLAAVVVGLCFACSLFLWPLFVVIPAAATTPALVVVGVLMLQGVARIDLTEWSSAVTVSLTLLVTVLTNNLINGMAVGTLAFLLLGIAAGDGRRMGAVVWGLAVVFVAFFVVTTHLP
ncbi:NCS2 family permease [Rhizosaccharibacter radicis]|uniref:NCS2 family permease n=1 Tax=Rhizosaccharibacter radicis TaxID=2782605 RepID=A0ABT1W3X3_9PROT|nr:NCS2 family permease [Acetobacteraceae bacterium KSS12]